MWFLAVPGGISAEIERDVRVTVSGIPPHFVLESVEPETVRVRVAGRRRDLYLLRDEHLQVRVDAILVDLGRRTFSISARDVIHPERVEIRAVVPDQVKIQLKPLCGAWAQGSSVRGWRPSASTCA